MILLSFFASWFVHGGKYAKNPSAGRKSRRLDFNIEKVFLAGYTAY